jgi:hypothetical protein
MNPFENHQHFLQRLSAGIDDDGDHQQQQQQQQQQ